MGLSHQKKDFFCFVSNSERCHMAAKLAYRLCRITYYHSEKSITQAFKNVKTVHVAGHFGKVWSTKSPPISVLLNARTVFKVAVPQTIKHYFLKELVKLYSKLVKNHGHAT